MIHVELPTFAIAVAPIAGTVNAARSVVNASTPAVPLLPFVPALPLGPGMSLVGLHAVGISYTTFNQRPSDVEFVGLMIVVPLSAAPLVWLQT